jgi:hypothetical protein
MEKGMEIIGNETRSSELELDVRRNMVEHIT